MPIYLFIRGLHIYHIYSYFMPRPTSYILSRSSQKAVSHRGCSAVPALSGEGAKTNLS
jgi:hypothetical protein